MAVNSTFYAGANAGRGPSPAIWNDARVAEGQADRCVVMSYYDDFGDMPLVGTQTTQIGFGKYKVFATSGSAVVPLYTVNSVKLGGGILSLTTDTDNDSASIAQAYPQFRMSGSGAEGGPIYFEASIAVNTIATDTMGFMLGLAETDLWTLATGVPFNAGDPITNGAAFIGFRKGEDALGVVDTVVSDRATSFTNIGASALTLSATYTFHKLGLIYDPNRTSDCVRFFLNGTQLTTAYTKTLLSATTNLKAGALGPICAIIADSGGTSNIFFMKWWRWAQIYNLANMPE